ncbi:EAL domain-containing protein [Wenzhouxiangella sp. XN79A]|uniref:EAL domain-containing protein n=1 Tax=Wenzhouxiangella sp. XN79A TaxID=2724193 RepID=UPI00144ABAA4|nr:EAL domain-containing protein [Wenzhouxiangella sp. XN79A]NKI36587.1 EAL domain-containing protein [Wenzhouxiangella sp. XN79A]
MARQAYLESFSRRGTGQRFDLVRFPAEIGRHPDCAITLNVERVSRRHARIDREIDGSLRVTDLGSTNGTYLNGERLTAPAELVHGDVLHIGDQEYRLIQTEIDDGPELDDATRIGITTLPSDFPTQAREFNELLAGKQVCGYRQAIVHADGSPFGFELLGRATHPRLDAGPGPMFKLAEALGEQVRLSELLRRIAFAEAAACGLTEPLFFNTHPEECKDDGRLLDELTALREAHPGLNLVFEVHEAAVTDLERMARIRERLRGLDIRLAYDDFGAGQARLLELIEVPPDVLKFDIALMRGLDGPDSPKYRLLRTLNTMIQELGVRTLAEGVETEVQAEACRTLGIDYVQGFFYGRPEPLLPAAADAPRTG